MVASAIAAIALGLLAASGVAKLLDPKPTTGAMRAAQLPSGNGLTYALGIVELGVGVTAMADGGPALLAGALLYAAFTVFTLAAVRNRIPVQSCGCFGREDTPPNSLHVISNAVATASLVVAALTRGVPIDWELPLGELILYISFVSIGVYAAILLMTRVSMLLSLVRS